MGARWDASDRRGRFLAIVLLALATWNVGSVIYDGDNLPWWLNALYLLVAAFCLVTMPFELKWGRQRRERRDAGDSGGSA